MHIPPIFSYIAISLCCLITPFVFCFFCCHELNFFSFAAVNWTGEHRAFIMETFIKTNESVTATQRGFRLHFNLGKQDLIPARSTTLLWVTNFRAIGSALKRKSTDRSRTAKTLENKRTSVNVFNSVSTIMDPI